MRDLVPAAGRRMNLARAEKGISVLVEEASSVKGQWMRDPRVFANAEED